MEIGVQNGPGAAPNLDPPGVVNEPPGGVAEIGGGRGLFGLATGLLLHRLAEAVAFAVHLEYLAVMRQTIQERRRHPLALKDLSPVAEGKVAGDQ